MRVGELLVVLRADAPDPDVGVEGRVAGHGDDLAGLDVEHQRGAAGRPVIAAAVRQIDSVAERFLGLRLDLRVDGRHQGVARLRQTAAGHGVALLGAAEGIDLDLGHAVAATQPAVITPFEAALADQVAWRRSP